MINFESVVIENKGDGPKGGWGTKVTDEYGNPINGIKSLTIHVPADGVVTADITMYCSNLKICADHTNVEECCPILGISMLNRHKGRARIVPYKDEKNYDKGE